MRLTADLIAESRAFYNPLRERELDLRGCKIPLIENLGATKDQFDCLDLTDNDVRKLDNFPVLKRLKMILLSNNQVSRVDPAVGAQLPRLHTLILTNNKVAHFADVDALASLPALAELSLVDNPVALKEHYRLYVIRKIPQLKVLDFRRIRPRERKAATALFASDEGKRFAESVQREKRTFVPGQLETASGAAATPEQIEAIKAAIAAAKTPAEVEALEQQLLAGMVPSAAHAAGAGAGV
mmetsp:Transcript_16034/g.51068  ORF Transcript_16034/g.51068 Transcript_16034/m.51068 type:complete len:240 (-) Transcript_16034:28-747(-)